MENVDSAVQNQLKFVIETTEVMWLFYGKLPWARTLYEPISGYQMMQVSQKHWKALCA